MSTPVQSRGWLVLLGIAGLGAGLLALVEAAVEVPGAFLLSGRIERAAQPGAYWLLTLSYLVIGAFFLYVVLGRRDDLMPVVEEKPRRPSPGWARALAWVGVIVGVLFLAAAVFFQLAMDPIISLPFVGFCGAAGLFFTLTAIGYLVTGRVQ
jgi:hypothetical protein